VTRYSEIGRLTPGARIARGVVLGALAGLGLALWWWGW
jgi:hypothetical protein